jgi:hypothetical protein
MSGDREEAKQRGVGNINRINVSCLNIFIKYARFSALHDPLSVHTIYFIYL